jgi:hypothetical protein
MDTANWMPDRKTYESHLCAFRFMVGIDQGRWVVLKSEFPNLYIRVIGKDDDSGITFTQDFHLVCDGYPYPGPFVERWDFDANCRPSPVAHGSPGFVDALKDWSESGGIHGGIYRGWQRIASTHNGWAQKYPDQAWNKDRDLTFIMEKLYELVVEQATWLGYNRQPA